MKKRNDEIRCEEELVASIKKDFQRRQEERISLEQQWKLNINYLIGNQYCEISPTGEVEEEEKYYYWQNRNVYNHIAPIIETRLAKLSRVRPIMSVRASGSEENDLKTAKLASDVLNSTFQRLELDGIISKATLWSEVLGTSFYKIVWSAEKGKILGKTNEGIVHEGDVSVIPVSPFEIYPDCLFREDIDSLKSIIHARAMHIDDIERIFGIRVVGEDINVFTTTANQSIGQGSKISGGVVHDNALVIERYEMPSKEFPCGRVVTVAGDKLLSISVLPFENGTDGERKLPFIKQDSIQQPGCFFSSSVVERVIPLQRAYNAVKNRKHEFLNRVSMGVVTVEDGSIDTDELAEEGLSPGKVIVYRQGSRPPQMMTMASVPIDFTYEEDRLTNEFVTVSGVSEVSRGSAIPDNVTSGVALQLLLEQDETRLSATAENVRRAVKQIGKHIIRLFRQFATETRMMKIAGESSKAELFYFSQSDLTSDDVVFDTQNELTVTPAQKKAAVMEMFNVGLLNGENGTIDERTKAKILDILGFGSLDNAQDLTNLHIAKASKENVEFASKNAICEVFDDHNIHIKEHTRFLLSGEIDGFKNKEQVREKAIKHLEEHKKCLLKSEIQQIDKIN